MFASAESLGELVKEVAHAEIVPRFRNLAAGDIVAKPTKTDPNDLVTSADRAAESALARRLSHLVPGSCVVGEEGVCEQPRLLESMGGDDPVWLVDPLDGTKNFARGQGPFGTMVALMKRGQIVLAAIYLILEKDLYVAEHGAGALRNGNRLQPASPKYDSQMGTLYTKFMDPKSIERLNLSPSGCELRPPPMCAAFEYGRLARAEYDFALFSRLLPWDHAAGALILREVKGVARHLDGTDYSPLGADSLLLVASSESRWQSMREKLLG